MWRWVWCIEHHGHAIRTVSDSGHWEPIDFANDPVASLLLRNRLRGMGCRLVMTSVAGRVSAIIAASGIAEEAFSRNEPEAWALAAEAYFRAKEQV